MPSIQELINIGNEPVATVELRDFDSEFSEIIKGSEVHVSFGAKVLDASGVELEDFEDSTIETFAASVDAGVVSNIATQYDNKHTEYLHEEFLKSRELNYATAVEGDPDFLG